MQQGVRSGKQAEMQRLLLAILFCALALLALGRQAHAQAGIAAPHAAESAGLLTLAEYRALLNEIRGDLLAVPRPDAILPWMQGRLAAVEGIELPTGEVMQPVNLLRNATTAEQAIARIDALQAQLDIAANDRLAERQGIVVAVLSQRAYQQSFNLWETILGWIERLWRWLFPDGRNPFATDEASALFSDAFDFAITAITIFGGIAIALLLGWWAARLYRNFVRDTELQRRRGAGDDMPASAAEARAIAAEQARGGSFRAAVRSMYLSALLALEEAEIVAHDRTLTNRELLARAGGYAAGGEIRPAMQPVVQGFDDVWYGVVEPDAVTYSAYEANVATLNKRIQELADERTRAGASETTNKTDEVKR